MKCTECFQDKAEEEFSFRNKTLGLRRAQCKVCVRTLDGKNYRQNPARRQKIRDTAKAARLRNRELIFEYLKSHPCVECGESDIVVLEFDHLTDKRKDVMLMVDNGCSIETVKKEIEKCEVVCANDHKRRTSRRGNHWRVALV